MVVPYIVGSLGGKLLVSYSDLFGIDILYYVSWAW